MDTHLKDRLDLITCQLRIDPAYPHTDSNGPYDGFQYSPPSKLARVSIRIFIALIGVLIGVAGWFLAMLGGYLATSWVLWEFIWIPIGCMLAIAGLVIAVSGGIVIAQSTDWRLFL